MFDVEASTIEIKYISVVITCHQRKEFLIEAIDSVLNQSISKTKYEILLVIDFVDKEIEDYCRKSGVIIIYDPRIGIGVKMAIGIEKAKGEIICFLNDDDKFLPRKLELILKYFKSYPEIAYLHNNYLSIDKFSHSLNRIRISDLDRVQLIDNSAPKNWIVQGFKNNLMFNDSCICIRRDSFLQHIELLTNIYGNQDNILFYLGLNSGRKLMFIPEKLTLFRVHETNTSNEKNLTNYSKLLNRRILSLINTLTYLEDKKPVCKILDFLYSDAKSQIMQYEILNRKDKKHLNYNLVNSSIQCKKLRLVYTRNRLLIQLLYIFSLHFPGITKKLLWNRIEKSSNKF
jgi:glycosyltransferase involved in cell wall biosynthesis